MDTPVPNSTPAPGQDGIALSSTNADLQALLGPPPLILGEDNNAYAELLAHVQASVRPKDIIEEFWVRDVVDLVWEALRLRRLKANLLVVTAQKAITKVLTPVIGFTVAKEAAGKWSTREPESVDEFEEILRDTGLSMDVVMAQALHIRLDDIERIDRMIMSAEVRRNAVLREVDRHRAAFADALRRAAENVRDAEFTEVGGDGVPA